MELVGAQTLSSLVGAATILWDGTSYVRVRVPGTFVDVATVAVGTITTVWTPTSGMRIRLMGGCVSLSAAGSLLFEDNAAAAPIKFRTPSLLVNTPYNFEIPGGLLLSAADNVLKVTSSVSANLVGTLWGTLE